MEKKSWPEYYRDKINNKESENQFFVKYKMFLELIVKIALQLKQEINIVEIGCGIGTVSKMLMQKFPEMNDVRLFGRHGKYILTDCDVFMLELARRNMPKDKMGNEISLCRYNLLNDFKHPSTSNFWNIKDLIITHGVLEHFSKPEIEDFIDKLDNDSRVLAHIHYVPTSDYKTKSFGDENLWAISTWIKLVNPDIVVKNGPDLYLVKLKGINQL